MPPVLAGAPEGQQGGLIVQEQEPEEWSTAAEDAEEQGDALMGVEEGVEEEGEEEEEEAELIPGYELLAQLT